MAIGTTSTYGISTYAIGITTKAGSLVTARNNLWWSDILTDETGVPDEKLTTCFRQSLTNIYHSANL
jgi:hypothetical protein